MNYTPQAINRFEKGIVNIDLALVDKLCRILDCSLESFIDCDTEHIKPYQNNGTFDKKLFARLLRYLRDKKLISQGEAADALDVSNSKYSKWENGISIPSIDNFKKLCQFFNISYVKLYYCKIEIPVPAEIIENQEQTYIQQTRVKQSRKQPFGHKWVSVLTSVLLAILLAGSVTTSVVFGYFLFSDQSTQSPTSGAENPGETQPGTQGTAGINGNSGESRTNITVTYEYYYKNADNTHTMVNRFSIGIPENTRAFELNYTYENYSDVTYYKNYVNNVFSDEFDFTTTLSEDTTIYGLLHN